MVLLVVRTSESELYFPEDYSLHRKSSVGPVCGEVYRKKWIGLGGQAVKTLDIKRAEIFLQLFWEMGEISKNDF